MNIKEFTKAILRCRIIKLWSVPEEPSKLVMGGHWRGRYLLLGDDDSIKELIKGVFKS